jgi:hypothetical protein
MINVKKLHIPKTVQHTMGMSGNAEVYSHRCLSHIGGVQST